MTDLCPICRLPLWFAGVQFQDGVHCPDSPALNAAVSDEVGCLRVGLASALAREEAAERENEAWRALNEWAGGEWHSVTLSERLSTEDEQPRFGMRGHRYGGTHSVGPFWYGEGDSPRAAAIDLATKLGLLKPVEPLDKARG